VRMRSAARRGDRPVLPRPPSPETATSRPSPTSRRAARTCSSPPPTSIG
jgi:hypothetical protein